MSYETPIKLAMTMERVTVLAREEQDKRIYQAVLDSGINVSREELIKALKYDRDQYVKGYEDGKAEAMQWIPIKFKETTDEDGFDKEEYPIMLDCSTPEDGQEILVCTDNGYVMFDTFFNDDGCYLDSGYDLEEIVAWMPLPEPYKVGDQE